MSLRQDERCCTDVFDDTNNAHAGLARDCGWTSLGGYVVVCMHF
jgi:hypothetical protein